MDREKVIKELERIRDICNAKSNMAIGQGKIAWAGYANAADDAIAMLNDQQPKTGHWLKKMPNYPSAIATGGSRTSACDLCGGWGRKTFKYCPNCGAKMEEPTRT